VDLLEWLFVPCVVVFGGVTEIARTRRSIRWLAHHTADIDRRFARQCVEVAGTLFEGGHAAEAARFEKLATTLETSADRFERHQHRWWPVRPQRTQD
jgi:hypothetical protein